MEKFYFRSYDRIIGEASNVYELRREIERLSSGFPEAVEYHLTQGHIVQWLEYMGEIELAKRMEVVKTISEAHNALEKHMEKAMIIQRMTHGRMH